MLKDSKIIVGLTCLGAALAHVFCLALVQGSMLVFYLEYPFFAVESLLFDPVSEKASPLLLNCNLWVGGSVFYAVVVGIPFGLVFVGIRRLFKWLNDDKWIHDA